MVNYLLKWLAIGLIFLSPAIAICQNWTIVDTGLPRAVRSMYVDSNYLYVGVQSGGSYSNNIRIWNGSQWDTMPSPCFNLGGMPLAITKYQGNIVIGTDCGTVLRWTGTNWTVIGAQSTGAITGLYATGNDLYAVGWFDTISGVPASKIARWNGTNWSAIDTTKWGGGTAASVTVYNGDLYFGGNMWNYNGTLDRIARWNGTQWLPVGNGIIGGSATVNCFETFNGELYVGGMFNTSQGNPGNAIARWDGIQWLTVGGGMASGSSQVFSLKVFNNELYAGGNFSAAGGVPAQFIAKWDGTNWCGFGDTFYPGGVLAIESYMNELYIGGGFKTINSDTINYISKWIGGNFTTSCGNTIGIKENNLIQNQISVYPNPTTNILHISTEQNELQNSEIEIINSLGQTVLKPVLSTAEVLTYTYTIDISKLAKGFYSLKITSQSKQVFYSKFIKE